MKASYPTLFQLVFNLSPEGKNATFINGREVRKRNLEKGEILPFIVIKI